MAWRAFRDPSLPLWARWLPALGLLYIVSPIDLVPDFFPVVGWIDDLGIGGTALAITVGTVMRHAEKLRDASRTAAP